MAPVGWMRMKIRQRMRNITAGLLTAALCLGLCACKDRTGPAEEPEPVTFRLGYSQSPGFSESLRGRVRPGRQCAGAFCTTRCL